MNLPSVQAQLSPLKPRVFAKPVPQHDKPKKMKQLAALRIKREEECIVQSKTIAPVIQTCLCLIEANNQLMEKTIAQEDRSLQLSIQIISKCHQLGLNIPLENSDYRGGFFYVQLYEQCLLQKDLAEDQEMRMPKLCRQNEWLRKGIIEARQFIRRGDFLIQALKVLEETLDKKDQLRKKLKSLDQQIKERQQLGKDMQECKQTDKS